MNKMNENHLKSNESRNINIKTTLENLTNSIQKGKFQEVIQSYMNLKIEEYSLILKEIETTKFEDEKNFTKKLNSNENPSHEISKNNINHFPTNYESLSDQIKRVKTINKLKKFKPNQDKLLTDLILRKHSSKNSNTSLKLKKIDSLNSSEVFKSFEYKTSFETAKDDTISLKELKIFSSIDGNSIENFQSDVMTKNVNLEENLSHRKDKLKDFAIKFPSSNDDEPNLNFNNTRSNRNLMNKVINVKLKIFQPIFD